MSEINHYVNRQDVRCAYKDIEIVVRAQLSKKALAIVEAQPNQLLICTTIVVDSLDEIPSSMAATIYRSRSNVVAVVLVNDLAEAVRKYNASKGLPVDDAFIRECIKVNSGFTWSREVITRKEG